MENWALYAEEDELQQNHPKALCQYAIIAAIKVIIRMVDAVIKEEITKTTKHTFLKVKNPISTSYLRSQLFYMSASKFSANTSEKNPAYIDELVTKF